MLRTIGFVTGLGLAAAAPAMAEGPAYRVRLELVGEATDGQVLHRASFSFLALSGGEIRLAQGAEGVEAVLEFSGTAGERGLEYEVELEAARGANKFQAALSGFARWSTEEEVCKVSASVDGGPTWTVRLAAEGAPGEDSEVRRSPVERPPAGAPALKGVLVEPEGPARAILDVGNRTLEVEVGDLVPGDWQVSAIEADRVVLTGPGGVTRTLKLED